MSKKKKKELHEINLLFESTALKQVKYWLIIYFYLENECKSILLGMRKLAWMLTDIYIYKVYKSLI